jgi:hypothetical protein
LFSFLLQSILFYYCSVLISFRFFVSFLTSLYLAKLIFFSIPFCFHYLFSLFLYRLFLFFLICLHSHLYSVSAFFFLSNSSSSTTCFVDTLYNTRSSPNLAIPKFDTLVQFFRHFCLKNSNSRVPLSFPIKKINAILQDATKIGSRTNPRFCYKISFFTVRLHSR